MILKDILFCVFLTSVIIVSFTSTIQNRSLNFASYDAGDCVEIKAEEEWQEDVCLHIIKVGNKNYLGTTCQNYNEEVSKHGIVTQVINFPFTFLNKVGNKVECR